MKVSGAVAMADHVEAFGLTESQLSALRKERAYAQELADLDRVLGVERPVIKFSYDQFGTDAP